MHYLVRLIVEADSAEEANSQADYMMMDLVEQREFDWYHDTPANSRWEDCWKPVHLSNKKAQTWVKDAMDRQLSEFKQSMKEIRFMLDGYTDEQIFNEEFEQVGGQCLSRYQFSRASGCHANTCQIFGDGGSSIISQRELDWYLDHASNRWVVQIDCHN